MKLEFSPYVFIMMIAAVICVFIVVYVWIRRRKNSETIPLTVLMLVITEWIAAALLGLLDQNLSHNILWARVEYIGVVSVPLSLLVYVLYHYGYKEQLTSKRLAWLTLIPLVTLGLAWTNGYHGLIWVRYVPYLENGLVLSEKTYGLGFWVYWTYSYLVLLAATVVTIRQVLVSAKIFRWQGIVVVIGILVPWVGNLVYVLHINPFGNLDLTPLSFSVTGIMVAIGMFRWQLFDIRPVAQAAVIAGMADGLMILDDQDRVVEVNPAAQAILGLSTEKLIGEQMEKIIANRLSPGEKSRWKKGRTIELKFTRAGKNRDYQLSGSPFYQNDDALGGKIIFLHDVTDRKRLEEKLREMERKHAEALLRQVENKYETLYQNMSVGVFYQSADGRLTDMNPAAERILGARLEEICDLASMGDKLETVHEDGSAFPVEEHPGMVSLKTGKPLRNQLMGVFFPNESGYHWINVNTVPQFKPGEDQPFQVFVTLDDITERKLAEEALALQSEELRQRNDELARLYRSSESLIPGASYNFRNLAQTIVEFVSREFGTSDCCLYLTHSDAIKLDRIAAVGPFANQLGMVEFTLSDPGPVPQAMRSGQITLIADTRRIPGVAVDLEEPRSGLIAPLRIGDRVIGAIDVRCPEPNGFSANDERLMSIFIERAALALEHARLYAEAERHLNHLTALRTIDMAITNSFNLELTLDIIIERLIEELEVHAADILVYQPSLQILEFACGRGFRSHAFQNTHLKLSDGYVGRVVLERRIIHIPNLANDPGAISKSRDLSDEDFVAYVSVPLIAKGQIKGVLEIFHREILFLEQEWIDFLETLAGQAAIAVDNVELFENLQHSNAELVLAYDKTLAGWASALELRDKETEGHTQRVARETLQLAREMGLGDMELVHINRGALLHDIGKMGVPDDILLKPGPLSEEEWEIMRKHPQYAYNMLSPISFLKRAIDIPYSHHEKWDGTGYPLGLNGEQIPLSARIFAVIDVVDALLSDRPYRKAWPREKVIEYIKSQAGTHFDPKVVQAFLSLESH
jgi:PAS domain S-box-containing protein/putative nucleotidyltransferase with HDIG domain